MSHDFDPRWSYTIDHRPLPAVKQYVEEAKRTHGPIWKALGFTKKPRFVYVRDLSAEHLARYVGGTESEPVFVLDARAIALYAQDYRVDLKTAVWVTLLHEYGHAYVESVGLHDELEPDDEEWIVEQFAQTAWEDDWRVSYALSELNERLEKLGID